MKSVTTERRPSVQETNILEEESEGGRERVTVLEEVRRSLEETGKGDCSHIDTQTLSYHHRNEDCVSDRLEEVLNTVTSLPEDGGTLSHWEYGKSTQ